MGSVAKGKGKTGGKKPRKAAKTSPSFPGVAEIKEGESVIDWILKNPVKNANLPRDFSLQHDHYLYGTPKKKVE